MKKKTKQNKTIWYKKASEIIRKSDDWLEYQTIMSTISNNNFHTMTYKIKKNISMLQIWRVHLIRSFENIAENLFF